MNNFHILGGRDHCLHLHRLPPMLLNGRGVPHLFQKTNCLRKKWICAVNCNRPNWMIWFLSVKPWGVFPWSSAKMFSMHQLAQFFTIRFGSWKTYLREKNHWFLRWGFPTIRFGDGKMKSMVTLKPGRNGQIWSFYTMGKNPSLRRCLKRPSSKNIKASMLQYVYLIFVILYFYFCVYDGAHYHENNHIYEKTLQYFPVKADPGVRTSKRVVTRWCPSWTLPTAVTLHMSCTDPFGHLRRSNHWPMEVSALRFHNSLRCLQVTGGMAMEKRTELWFWPTRAKKNIHIIWIHNCHLN